MSSVQEVQERLDGFVRSCKVQGVRATHQRIEILRELASSEEHPDAETVYKGVQQRIPTISLDTVYRALRLLEEKGVISRVGCTRDRARYDANTDQHRRGGVARA